MLKRGKKEKKKEGEVNYISRLEAHPSGSSLNPKTISLLHLHFLAYILLFLPRVLHSFDFQGYFLCKYSV